MCRKGFPAAKSAYGAVFDTDDSVYQCGVGVRIFDNHSGTRIHRALYNPASVCAFGEHWSSGIYFFSVDSLDFQYPLFCAGAKAVSICLSCQRKTGAETVFWSLGAFAFVGRCGAWVVVAALSAIFGRGIFNIPFFCAWYYGDDGIFRNIPLAESGSFDDRFMYDDPNSVYGSEQRILPAEISKRGKAAPSAEYGSFCGAQMGRREMERWDNTDADCLGAERRVYSS